MTKKAEERIPSPPRGAKAEGRRLWRRLCEAYQFEEHELVLLRQAVRLVDALTALDALVEKEGTVVTTPSGVQRAHPALVEARQSRIALARTLAVLRLPAGEDAGQLRRPQRRSGVRTPYQLHQLPTKRRSAG